MHAKFLIWKVALHMRRSPEVRNLASQEASLPSPMFEPEEFRKQMYCIEESTCVGTFLRPHGDSVPGELCPPRYAPVWLRQV